GPTCRRLPESARRSHTIVHRGPQETLYGARPRAVEHPMAMGELRRLALLGAVALAVHAAPAAAATKVVDLGNGNKLTPTAGTISPGDTVTWDWVGPDTDHSPEAFDGQAEYWDADPGEDGEYD